MHLVGFAMEIYSDARSYKRKIGFDILYWRRKLPKTRRYFQTICLKFLSCSCESGIISRTVRFRHTSSFINSAAVMLWVGPTWLQSVQLFGLDCEPIMENWLYCTFHDKSHTSDTLIKQQTVYTHLYILNIGLAGYSPMWVKHMRCVCVCVSCWYVELLAWHL